MVATTAPTVPAVANSVSPACQGHVSREMALERTATAQGGAPGETMGRSVVRGCVGSQLGYTATSAQSLPNGTRGGSRAPLCSRAAPGLRCAAMKKLLLLAVLIALGAVAARKLRTD